MFKKRIKKYQDQKFEPPCPLRTPVLFLIYKRPDTTKQVFEAIRKAKPPRLYIAADGPKLNIPGEFEKVKETREVILNHVDWDCEINTLLRDENLGCRQGVSSGIDWFFLNEDQGIILEDDTLPRQSFFWFCQELLEHFKDDKRIGMISGNNRFENTRKKSDFFLSKHGLIWGWATWKDTWNKCDIDMKSYNSESKKKLYDKIGSWAVVNFWDKNFKKVAYSDFDTWDYQWTYCRYINGFLTIRPKVNLVKNIGFGNDATHTKGFGRKKYFVNKEIYFPLIYPEKDEVDDLEDKKLEKEWIYNKAISEIKSKLFKMLKK